MKKSIFLIVLSFVLLSSCSSLKNITRKGELYNPRETGVIRVLANDSSVYKLEYYRVTDSTLTGNGTVKKEGITKTFNGEIKLSDISYIQASHFDFLKSLIFVGSVGVFGYTAINYLGNNNSSGIRENAGYVSPYGGGSGGSCPYIYAWNGNRYILEGEAFGTSLGKALERETCTILSSLKDQNSILKVKLANQRPETHYFNSVSLAAIESDSSASVYSDNFNNYWQVNNPQSPLSAFDKFGNDITNKLKYKNKDYWEINLTDLKKNSNNKDEIYLSFPRTSSDSGSLIIIAINTQIINVVYKKLSELLGDQYLQFISAVDNDPEMISIMKKWLENVSLKIYLWNGKEWQKAGLIYPEANSVPFTKLVRLNTYNIKSDTIKIKLEALSDVWKLDAVNIDWTPSHPLEGKKVKIISAVGPGNRDVSNILKFKDKNYVVLVPSQEINLKFKAVSPGKGKKINYSILADGYLYEWPAETSGSDFRNASFFAKQDRVKFLKYLFKAEQLYLSIIYSEWEKVRH